METLKLDLTIEESNIILKGLSEMPYIQVTSLIQKIRNQADQQLQLAHDVDEITSQPDKQPVAKKGKLNGKKELAM